MPADVSELIRGAGALAYLNEGLLQSRVGDAPIPDAQLVPSCCVCVCVCARLAGSLEAIDEAQQPLPERSGTRFAVLDRDQTREREKDTWNEAAYAAYQSWSGRHETAKHGRWATRT